MNNAADGMNYAPKGKPNPVVGPGEFGFSAIRLDHGHINGMCNGLTEAGATLRYVYDPDPEKVAAFVKAFPQVKVASSEQEIFDDPQTKLIAGAAVTSERCPLGIRAMEAGKDYFTDKAPLVSLEQLEAAKECVKRTVEEIHRYAALAGEILDSLEDIPEARKIRRMLDKLESM